MKNDDFGGRNCQGNFWALCLEKNYDGEPQSGWNVVQGSS